MAAVQPPNLPQEQVAYMTRFASAALLSIYFFLFSSLALDRASRSHLTHYLSDFVLNSCVHSALTGLTFIQIDAIRKVWNAFDLNKDNRVDKNEMRLVLKQLLGGERELDASEFEEVWGQIDFNKDGPWLQVNHFNLIFEPVGC